MYTTSSFVVAALQKGATSFVPRGSEYKIILQVLEETAAGNCFLGPPLSTAEILAELKTAQESRTEFYEELTDRQRAVWRLVAEGYTRRQRAARFHISPRTVEMHRTPPHAPSRIAQPERARALRGPVGYRSHE